MKHVVDLAADSWDAVSNITLQRAWNKLWPPETIESSQADTQPDLVPIFTTDLLNEMNASLSVDNNEIEEWLHIDDNEIGFQLLTDDEIIDTIDEEEADSSDVEYDGGDNVQGETAKTAKDEREEAKKAVSNIQQYIEWFEQQSEASNTDTMLLRRLRNFAVKKAESTAKQTKLTEFFTKQT